MKTVIGVLIFFFILSGFVFENSVLYGQQKTNSKNNDRALSQIKSLPEVKEFLRKNKKEKAALYVAREPDSTFKYYWIKLGISNFDMFRTSSDFYLDPKTWKIYFLDLMDSSGSAIIPLQQWRIFRSDPRFFKIHKIKNGKIIVSDKI